MFTLKIRLDILMAHPIYIQWKSQRIKPFYDYLCTLQGINSVSSAVVGNSTIFKITFESEEYYTWFLMGLATPKDVDI